MVQRDVDGRGAYVPLRSACVSWWGVVSGKVRGLQCQDRVTANGER